MAVIGKIQKNSLLLLIVIGLAMLAFIFTDSFKNSNDQVEILPTGTIYGEPLDEKKHSEMVDLIKNRDQSNAQYEKKEYTEQDSRNSEDQAFNELVRQSIMNTEFEKLGIETTVEELNDMIHGNHIHPYVMQIPNFNGALGFSRDSVRNFVNNLENEPSDPDQRKNWIDLIKRWKSFENDLKDARAVDKYVTLIKKGLFVNSLEAADSYKATEKKKEVKFVLQRYSDIPAEEVEITDEEIETYFNEHKNDKEYEQIESRNVEFIQFDITPADEDKRIAVNQMEMMKESFTNAVNNSAFMASNSQLIDGQNMVFANDSSQFKIGTDAFVYENAYGLQYPASIDEAIQEADSGDVIGPVISGNDLVLAKVVEIKKEKQAWVRHILIKSDETRTVEQAKAKADSVIAIIKENDNFTEMVSITDDPGSIATNGEYKWFPEGRMVPEFNDASFNGKIGDIQLVKTTYGYHIVEVLGRGDRVTPKLAIVGKKVRPSDNTIKYKEEQMFDYIYTIQESGKDSSFHKFAADSGFAILSSRAYLNSVAVNGFSKPESILRFAFKKDAKEGDMSNPILDDGKYTIAYISSIVEEGTPDFIDVKERMKIPALDNKKAALYIEKMAGKNSLEEVVAVTKRGAIMSAELTFATTAIQGGGSNEAKVIGELFTDYAAGSRTEPIQGKAGVYVFEIVSVTEAPETSDYQVIKENMNLQRQNTADNGVITALREKANVTDNRRKKQYM